MGHIDAVVLGYSDYVVYRGQLNYWLDFKFIA